MEKLKAGVIGVGHLGKIHARIYKEFPESIELVGVCDTDGSKEEVAKELGVPFNKNYKKILSKVDLVSICVPTSLHHSVAHTVLSEGVHCLVEKPIAYSLEQADELLAIAREKKLLLQVGHVERYNSGFEEIKKIVNNPRFIEIHRLGPFNPRIKDCGVVLDLMIHDLDILLSLVPMKVISNDAVGIQVITKYEDIANARLKFENACIVDITASRLTPEAQRKIRIFQPDAYVSLDYAEQTAKIFKKSLFNVNKKEIKIEKGESLKKEIEHFISKVQSKQDFGTPDVPARDALELALSILDSIKNSEKENQAFLKNQLISKA